MAFWNIPPLPEKYTPLKHFPARPSINIKKRTAFNPIGRRFYSQSTCLNSPNKQPWRITNTKRSECFPGWNLRKSKSSAHFPRRALNKKLCQLCWNQSAGAEMSSAATGSEQMSTSCFSLPVWHWKREPSALWVLLLISWIFRVVIEGQFMPH